MMKKMIFKFSEKFMNPSEYFDHLLSNNISTKDKSISRINWIKYLQKEKFEWIDKISELYEEILRDKECLSLKDLVVKGTDLIEKGVTPGKELGEILSAMLVDVLDEPSHNTKEYLLDETNFAGFRKGKV